MKLNIYNTNRYVVPSTFVGVYTINNVNYIIKTIIIKKKRNL